MQTRFDALIVGAGPAGSSAAILLASAGWSVGLIEKHTFPRRKVCGECLAASNLPLLDALGVGADFNAQAGPELRQVALMRGRCTVLADLPAAPHPQHGWGRALGRETLDSLLLTRAHASGATVLQPWALQRISGAAGQYQCTVRAVGTDQLKVLQAPVAILANGSWETLPQQRMVQRLARSGSDLLCFTTRARAHGATGGQRLVAPLGATVQFDGAEHFEPQQQRLRGPNLTYSTACSSSGVAIGEAWLRLACGALDVAIAGGSEAPLSLGSLKAWDAMHTLASVDPADAATSCKPFAQNRSGMVLGEGAALVLLEPLEHALARGAFIHGEIIGYGLTTDTGHIARPSVDGQAAAMHAALLAAGIEAQEVDSINAHGTGTVANDGLETAAIRRVFGERASRIPISATKALHGHLLGAAGALEFVLSLLALQHGVALPTMHLQQPDPACDLDYVPNVARVGAAGRTMLSNSFAFGGTNAVLALRAAD